MPVLDKAKAMIAHITERIAQIEASANACTACVERRARVVATYRAVIEKLRGRS